MPYDGRLPEQMEGNQEVPSGQNPMLCGGQYFWATPPVLENSLPRVEQEGFWDQLQAEPYIVAITTPRQALHDNDKT